MKRHVPDYLLSTDTRPVVVDVKPRDQLTKPKVARTLAWTRTVIESQGWRGHTPLLLRRRRCAAVCGGDAASCG